MRAGRGILLLCTLALLLDGCRAFRGVSSQSCHESLGYTSARSVPPLKIPAGLDAPDTSSALRLPDLKEPPPPPRSRTAPCLDAPPPFKVQQPRAPQA
jgi:uncharacterized lipoprotein